MVRRRSTAAGSVLAAVAVCAATLFTMGMGNKPATVDIARFSEDVQRDLPTGSSVSDVVRFLEARGLPHTGLNAPEEAIYSVVRVLNASKPGSALARVQLQFWFTQNGKLATFAVREYDASLN